MSSSSLTEDCDTTFCLGLTVAVDGSALRDFFLFLAELRFTGVEIVPSSFFLVTTGADFGKLLDDTLDEIDDDESEGDGNESDGVGKLDECDNAPDKDNEDEHIDKILENQDKFSFPFSH